MWIIKIHIDFAQKTRGFEGVEFGIHTKYQNKQIYIFLKSMRILSKYMWILLKSMWIRGK